MDLEALVSAALAEDLGDRGDVTSLVTIPEDARARGRIVARSGGMDLEGVARAAGCGVDCVSVGALTHSSPALDLALDLD